MVQQKWCMIRLKVSSGPRLLGDMRLAWLQVSDLTTMLVICEIRNKRIDVMVVFPRTKVTELLSLANQKEHRQFSEPIKKTFQPAQGDCFGVTSDWLRMWCEVFKLTTKLQTKPNANFYR